MIWELLMMTGAAQTHQAGHMRLAGRVFETPDLKDIINCKIIIVKKYLNVIPLVTKVYFTFYLGCSLQGNLNCSAMHVIHDRLRQLILRELKIKNKRTGWISEYLSILKSWIVTKKWSIFKLNSTKITLTIRCQSGSKKITWNETILDDAIFKTTFRLKKMSHVWDQYNRIGCFNFFFP